MKFIKSKWISFRIIEQKKRTVVVAVVSKCDDEKLGEIRWYPKWRHYCFFPMFDTVYSDRCLSEISKNVSLLNLNHGKVCVMAR